MLANDRPKRGRCRLFLGLALVIPSLIAGCGDGGSDKPAPVEAAAAKKAQEYFGTYREQLIANSKAKGKAPAAAKAPAAEKKSP
jgi:hypothetical protein